MSRFYFADFNILNCSLLWLDNVYAARYFAYR